MRHLMRASDRACNPHSFWVPTRPARLDFIGPLRHLRKEPFHTSAPSNRCGASLVQSRPRVLRTLIVQGRLPPPGSPLLPWPNQRKTNGEDRVQSPAGRASPHAPESAIPLPPREWRSFFGTRTTDQSGDASIWGPILARPASRPYGRLEIEGDPIAQTRKIRRH